MILLAFFLLLGLIKGELNLQKVVVVARHGDRTPQFDPLNRDFFWNCTLPQEIINTPFSIYSKNLLTNRNFFVRYKDDETLKGNCMRGQLTEIGMRQHYELGKRIREAYNSILPQYFAKEDVYVETTSYTRVRQSAMSQLMGVFPETKGDEEIVFVSQEEGRSDMYLNWFAAPLGCPKIKELFHEVEASQEWIDFHKKYEPFKRELIKKLDLEYTEDSFQYIFLHDSFICLQSHGAPLPPYATQEMIDKVESIFTTEYFKFYFTDEVIRLGVGQFMNRLINHFKANDNQYKYMLFLAHDVTIAPLVRLLQIKGSDEFWPDYAANVFFEIYTNEKNDVFIRTKYNEKVVNVGTCAEYCKIEDFLSVVHKYLPVDWNAECAVSNAQKYVMRMT